MSTVSDRERWNRKYANATGEPTMPARVLVDYEHLLPDDGQVLEIACGLGGNALWLAERGLTVEAWDVSEVALARLQAEADRRGVTVQTTRRDVHTQPPAPGGWDVIVITRFLDRSIAADIVSALRPGGLLFYQTFSRIQVGTGGPRNPAFRLADGELLALFAALGPVVYREEGVIGDTARGFRNQAMLIARRGD